MKREKGFVKKFNRITAGILDWAVETRARILVKMKLWLDMRARVRIIGGGYNGSSAEFKKVLAYWKKYGIRPSKVWYDCYCTGKKEYDPRFVPSTVWSLDILPYFNNLSMRNAYTDKGMLNRLLKGVMKPETVAKRIAGYYYNGDGEQLISQEEAERLCLNEERLIIKPFRGMKGQGIILYEKSGKDKIHDIISRIKGGFVAQRIVRQHKAMASLNKDSVNTIRVISFHFKEKIHILSAQVRVGGKGSFVDNYSSGGSACAVNNDGSLYPHAINKDAVWTDTSPGGVKYSDFKIPGYAEILNTARSLHSQLPYFNIIGWDFAIGEDCEPILLEFNAKPDQNQIGSGQPTFGDMTEEVLEDVFIKKTLKDVFAIDSDSD